MANLVKTISVTLRVWGQEPTEKYGTSSVAGVLVYGSDYWAYGTVGLPVSFYKGITDSFTVTNTVGKRFEKKELNTLVSTSTIALSLYKQVTDSIPLTSVIGKDIAHLYTNSLGTTTTIGRGFFKSIYESPVLTDNVSTILDYSRSFSQTLVLGTNIDVYQKRGNYDRIYGGISSIVDWPRPTVFTGHTLPTNSWVKATPTSTTWNEL